MNTKKKWLHTALLLISIATFNIIPAYGNITTELINVRALAEQTTIEGILGRFRSWYATEKLAGNNPDVAALPSSIFEGTNYEPLHSYESGQLHLSVGGLSPVILERLRSAMDVQQVGSEFIIRMERDGASMNQNVSTAHLISRWGGTFDYGADVRFQNGGIYAGSINTSDLTINGINFYDIWMENREVEYGNDWAVLKISNGGPLHLWNRTNDPIPVNYGIIESLDGRYDISLWPDGLHMNRVRTFGEVELPNAKIYGGSWNQPLQITGDGDITFKPNETSSSVIQMSGSDMDIQVDGTVAMSGNNIDISAEDGINIEGSTINLTSSTVKGNVEFTSDVVFNQNVRFANQVTYEDFIVTNNLNIGQDGKVVINNGAVEIDKTGIKGTDIDIRAKTIKINGKDIVTGDTNMLVALNNKIPGFNFFKTSSGNNSMTNDIPFFDYIKEISDDINVTDFTYSVEAGIRNVKTETPKNALPNLEGAVTYQNTKTGNMYIQIIPQINDTYTAIESYRYVYYTKVNMPVTATHHEIPSEIPIYYNNDIYTFHSVNGIEDIGSSPFFAATVFAPDGNPLDMLVHKDPVSAGAYPIWQPFALYTNTEGSDIEVRQATTSYQLTNDEFRAYNTARASGDYLVIEDVPLRWISFSSVVGLVGIVSVDDGRLYARMRGVQTETTSPISVEIPSDTVTITSKLNDGTQVSKTATVTYDNQYWSRMYEEYEEASVNIVSATPLPPYTGFYPFRDCVNILFIGPINATLWGDDSYDDVEVGGVTTSMYKYNEVLLPNEMFRHPGDVYIKESRYTDGFYFLGEAYAFDGDTIDLSQGNIFDATVEISTVKKLRPKSTGTFVNLVKDVTDNKIVFIDKKNNISPSDNVKGTLSTSVTVPESARQKFLRYDIYHDNFILQNMLLPMSMFSK
jgi:cytoskeletal protein CcmA (bactofilin family)